LVSRERNWRERLYEKHYPNDSTAIFPDSEQTLTQAAAEGDLVGVWCTYEGTQRGPIGPLPASGQKIKSILVPCSEWKLAKSRNGG